VSNRKSLEVKRLRSWGDEQEEKKKTQPERFSSRVNIYII